jgi:hypothetical protein
MGMDAIDQTICPSVLGMTKCFKAPNLLEVQATGSKTNSETSRGINPVILCSYLMGVDAIDQSIYPFHKISKF